MAPATAAWTPPDDDVMREWIEQHCATPSKTGPSDRWASLGRRSCSARMGMVLLSAAPDLDSGDRVRTILVGTACRAGVLIVAEVDCASS
ncbi:hypothetical protein GN244_ATG16437 [Phytophthora infestans]|uniref:Uncharacterized protein n=1 Tax=Phytophthora infestans TaxID=4787 RepID=A0A833W6G4_PHYIN|nr:hypothetical protein GN244_ATG16437 [Phytophthora infestans]KAF4140903.1 hypothetical protein GN958_ATG09751 [Phytophthora infestans]